MRTDLLTVSPLNHKIDPMGIPGDSTRPQSTLVALVSPILAAGAVPQRMLPLMICLIAWIGLAIAITVRRINRYRGGPRWFPPYGQDPLPEPVGTGAPRAPRPD
ncbi:hypothetical protein GGD89_000879 [Roseospira visakhapatnamensis]|uniref:Uncharacterized protein n=1 Tax=Roseospira visakhapatnamensis TaxID=390880 RepID=A0A7W6RBT0_9PROT|nr:hypothetical protein [Roseospira visakhapatnamensis]